MKGAPSLFRYKSNNQLNKTTTNPETAKIDPLLRPDPLSPIVVKPPDDIITPSSPIKKNDKSSNNTTINNNSSNSNGNHQSSSTQDSKTSTITPTATTTTSTTTTTTTTTTITSTNATGNTKALIIKSALITSSETISPKKKPYTVYRIEVETNEPSFYCVYKRYSEFLDLDLKLHAAFPLSKIPFPPKKTFGKMNNDFIVQRKVELKKFLIELIKILPSEPLVIQFFTQSDFDKQHQQHFESTQSNNNGTLILTSSDQVSRFIISTLPFWSYLLDYNSLLALTETCSYLLNTITNYPDLWRDLYIEHSSIYHYDTSYQYCSCPISMLTTAIATQQSQSFSPTLPSPSNNSNNSTNSSITIGNRTPIESTSPNPITNNNNNNMNSKLSPVSLSDSLDLNSRSKSKPIMTSSTSSLPSYSSSKFEYTRLTFLNLLVTHYKIRSSHDSHSHQQYCSCMALKFRGTIIGLEHIPDTCSFINSFNTEFENNPDTPQSTNNSTSNCNHISPHTNSSDSNYKISHIVAPNNKLLCVQFFGTVGDVVMEKQHLLSLSHFVIIAFSLIDKESYERVYRLYEEQVKLVSPELPIILVGLKRDMRELASPNESISYQQGLELCKNLPNCVAYIESPSASDGVGGWRRSLLSEIANHLCNHYKNVFTSKENNKNKYELMISFIMKLFPKYPSEVVYKSLSSFEGDINKTIESLAVGYMQYVPPVLTLSEQINRIKSRSSSTSGGSNTAPGSLHSRSPSTDGSRSLTTSGTSLKQSWNSEILRMDKESRDQLIEGYFKETDQHTGLSNSNNNNNSSRIQTSTHRRAQETQIHTLVEKLKKNSVDSFCKAFLKKKNQTQDQQAEIILSFLREMQTQLQSNQIFINNSDSSVDEDQLGPPLAEIEHHLYQNVYKTVFSSIESLERDALISERTSKLVFVEPHHLEIQPSHCNEDLWMAAQQELLNVNDLYSPSQKLECILNCCKIILFLLSTTDCPGGADDFLPHLIYVVIHANVPNLFSNFEFTSKFCNQELFKMERYYYFTTFGIAITFIENLDSKQLKIDPEEYHAYMSGKKAYKPQTALDPSKAKIMQKLGIDEKQAEAFVITSPKKKKSDSNNSDNDDIIIDLKFEKEKINQPNINDNNNNNNNNSNNNHNNSTDTNITNNDSSNNNNNNNNFKKSDSVPIFDIKDQQQPLLPWINSELPGSSLSNKRGSLRLTKTPIVANSGSSPTDSKLRPVNEHPLNST
ncbi:Phox domain-containing protein [Tieghemostelium lacteum]|uniref:Phox domain-containing protein n=1 Tax=Tieghemostelium lacteum TaxID=361077 RepID=A0A151ZDZ4_TIELA|nr:Phox domain-containing protein [Tieghemostelium lacteum]|eukprot:KYQ92182.1 Phox domain-containing protein [Tieghemostelium lacteum]